MSDKVLVAKESFFYSSGDGGTEMIKKGERFREGHPIPTKYADLFAEDVSVHEYENKRPVGRPRKSDTDGSE